MSARFERLEGLDRGRVRADLIAGRPAGRLDRHAASPVPAGPLASAGALEVRLARDDAEIERAMRLRWQVFAGELGAALGSPAGVDRDIFDPYCEHLVVIDRDSGDVIGTYRLLMPGAARRIGCLYSDGEFWLTRLDALRPKMVELGRSCVRADHRSGGVMMLLWSGLGALLARSEVRYLIGCVSVPMADGGGFAANLYRELASSHLADDTLRVWPRERLEVERHPHVAGVVPPPLVKGYLRAGACLLGEPHVDAQFNCADFPMMLDLAGLKARYQRRFVG